MWTSPIFPPSRVRKAPYGVMRLTVPSMTAPTSRSSARTPPFGPCSAGRSPPAHRRFASVPSARLGRQYDPWEGLRHLGPGFAAERAERLRLVLAANGTRPDNAG